MDDPARGLLRVYLNRRTARGSSALAAAAAGVILIALVSGAIPARRLARIDPVKTLRAE
jgi:ABC-type lipoprotein release transport system permease subunit